MLINFYFFYKKHAAFNWGLANVAVILKRFGNIMNTFSLKPLWGSSADLKPFTKYLETSFRKHVKLDVCGSFISLFRSIFMCFYQISSFGRKTGHKAILNSIFMLSKNFLISQNPDPDLVVLQFVRQYMHSFSGENNVAPFHLWWKENKVKRYEVSGYFVTACPENFLLFPISLGIRENCKNARVMKEKHEVAEYLWRLALCLFCKA